MRRLARAFGASFTLCEVFLDQFVVNVSKRSKARLYLAVRDSDHPCGAQLMGSNPDEIVPAAQRLVDFGFDLIDLNFACPVPKVVGKNRGGYLMSDVDKSLKIVDRVRTAIPEDIPLTVKLRRGFDDSPESRKNFFSILNGLLERGVAGITLHGRTVKQRYTGESDWNFLRQIKQYLVQEKKRPNFPVIGSGDLFSAEICLKRLQESGVDGIALARGIIGNPWLFAETRAAMTGQPIPPPPDLSEQRNVIAEHFRQVEELYGERRAVTVMRKFGICYSRRHPESQKVRTAFVQCKNRESWYQVLDDFYHD